MSQKEQEFFYQHSENFFRSIIASSFGLQVLDNFVNAIIRTLSAELEKFKDNKHILNLVMSYTPESAISPLHKRNREIDNQILIGNKGYFLKELTSFNFPVPSGFIITTEVFRGYEAVVGYKYIFKDLSKRIYKELTELERITGKKLWKSPKPSFTFREKWRYHFSAGNDAFLSQCRNKRDDSSRACQEERLRMGRLGFIPEIPADLGYVS